MYTMGIVTVTLTILILVSILHWLESRRTREHFESTVLYDPGEVTENCLKYVVADKGWKLDYGIPAPTSEQEQEARRKKIEQRTDVISQFQAIKSPAYSIWGQKFHYSDACMLRPESMMQFDADKGVCSIEGKVLADTTVNKYGRKDVLKKKVQLDTPETFRSVTKLNEQQMEPNDGCILSTTEKEEFFRKVDEIAAIKTFEEDNKVNLLLEENNRVAEKVALEQEQKIQAQNEVSRLQTYLNNATLVEKCRDVNTQPNNWGGGSFNYLDRHDVRCNDNEVLQRAKLSTDGKQIYYDMKCCSINTNVGENARFHTVEDKNTPDVSVGRTSRGWDARSLYNNVTQTTPKCDGTNRYLNGFHLNSRYRPDQFHYNYTCSDIDNDLLAIKPHKKIDHYCFDKSTPYRRFGSGAYTDLFYADMSCPSGSYLSGWKMEKDDRRRKNRGYWVNYKCCYPSMRS